MFSLKCRFVFRLRGPYFRAQADDGEDKQLGFHVAEHEPWGAELHPTPACHGREH